MKFQRVPLALKLCLGERVYVPPIQLQLSHIFLP